MSASRDRRTSRLSRIVRIRRRRRRVTDTEAGISREYFNPLGRAAPALVDTFDTCP